jgi:hypothetical protein
MAGQPPRGPQGGQAAPAIPGSRAAGSDKGWDLTCFDFRKYIFPLKNPRKSILTPKIVKPFQKISKMLNSGLGWCLLSFGS